MLDNTLGSFSLHNHIMRLEASAIIKLLTHHKLVLFAVDNDGGDLLVHEDEDDCQQGWDNSSDASPPRVKSHRVDHPATVGVSGLKNSKIPTQDTMPRRIYSTGYTSKYFTTEFHFLQRRSNRGVGNYLAKTLHQFIRISSYHVQEMWSGCWPLEPLTTPPIKSIPGSHCSRGSGSCLLVLNPFPAPTAYLTESFQTCLHPYTDKSTLTVVVFTSFFQHF